MKINSELKIKLLRFVLFCITAILLHVSISSKLLQTNPKTLCTLPDENSQWTWNNFKFCFTLFNITCTRKKNYLRKRCIFMQSIWFIAQVYLRNCCFFLFFCFSVGSRYKKCLINEAMQLLQLIMQATYGSLVEIM